MVTEARDEPHDRSSTLRERWRREGLLSTTTLLEAMRDGVASAPDTRAIFHTTTGMVETTAQELHAHSVQVAAELQQLGIARRDVIAIQVPNWYEGAVAYQAALLAGATVVPIIHIYGPGEVGFIIRESGARMLIVPDRWRNIDYLERLERLDGGDSLEHVVVIGDEVPPGCLSWSKLSGRGDRRYTDPGVRPDDVCLLVYTSGTTAAPKGVQHTHQGLLAELETRRQMQPLPANAVRLDPFPFGHIAGVLGLTHLLAYGSEQIIMDAWDAQAAAALIDEHDVVGTQGTPFHLMTLLDAAEEGAHTLHSLTDYLVGAASVPPELIERAGRHGIAAYRCYGSTEQPTISCGTVSDPLEKRARTDGRVCPGTEVRIVDSQERDLPPGRDGEILCRGPEQFVGYRDRHLDADSFVDGRWFRTGDLGRLDEDGYLTVTDRIKDVVIRGGETISSSEVESVLSTHPAAAEVAVLAAPHERLGECVCAFVTVRPGHQFALEDVRDHFDVAGVARQKTPERLEIVEEFPRTAAGKIQKYQLRERLS